MRQDLLYALRGLRRTPLAAVTVIATVALGLGLVAAVFTLFSAFFFRVDAVRDPQDLYAVERVRQPPAEQAPFTQPEFDALRRDGTVLVDAAAVRRGIPARIEGRAGNGTLVSGNFFHMLGATATLGRTLTPADDQRGAARNVIVLSHRGWTRLFARDPSVVGRVVRINGVPFDVAGVMPEGFRGLTIGAPDYWAPLAATAILRPRDAGREDVVPVAIVGRLKRDVPVETAAARLSLLGGPGTRVTLKPRRGTVANDAAEALLVFVPLFIAFGLILVIGCVNVANLLLARGVARQREIGIRLSVGASRTRVIRQLLTESLLLALAAAVCGFLISRGAVSAVLYAAATTLPPEIAETIGLSLPPFDWRVAVFLAAGAAVSTVFFGLVPAVQATRLELIRTMRGEVVRDGRPGRARSALIVAQVGASALLLICAAVFLRSAAASSAADLGFRTADTLNIEIASEPRRGAVVAAAEHHPSVASLAASLPHASTRPAETGASAHRDGTRTTIGYRLVSQRFFDTLDIPIVLGRGFESSERSEAAGVVVLSESAARQLWPGRSPLGERVRLNLQGDSTFAVVGLARDVPGLRFGDWTRAVAYVPVPVDRAGLTITVRARGNPDDAREVLLADLSRIDPALEDVSTLRAITGLETYLLRLGFRITLVLAALAVALTLSGLFSVLSYVVEQRTKEFGVRIALGATSEGIARLVLSQLAPRAALAAALTMVLRAAPVASGLTDVIQVLDPVAYTMSVLGIVPASALAAWLPAWRAGRIEPMTTLRQD